MTARSFVFTYKALLEQYRALQALGYRVLTCREYVEHKKAPRGAKILVNRVDVDFSLRKADRLADVMEEAGIKATFFLRLHAKEYNPFDFENFRVIKRLRDAGHEIGLHSEVVDESEIWSEPAEDCLRRDLSVLERMLGTRVVGVASHGGLTGWNNLDFWKDRAPAEFGLLYEGYDRQPAFNLFHESRYVSDAEWTRWKSYDHGVLRAEDRRPPDEHAREGVPAIYLLVHPDTYFERHFYE